MEYMIAKFSTEKLFKGKKQQQIIRNIKCLLSFSYLATGVVQSRTVAITFSLAFDRMFYDIRYYYNVLINR